MTRCNGVVTSAGGEAAPERRKGADDASWVDVNLTKLKIEEYSRGPFSCFKWAVKM
jgi:hypothetical protein